MKKVAKEAQRVLACLLLAIFLLTVGFPSQAGAVQMVSFTTSKTEVAHGENITVTISFSVFIPTAEGTTSASLYVYRNGAHFASMVHSGFPNSSHANQTVLLVQFISSYTIPEENVDSYLFTWTASANINGTVSEESGSASVMVLHSYGSWTHSDTTSGADSRHKRACICGRVEESPCSFTSAVTSPTCTEDGFTIFTCTEATCGYSYLGDIIAKTGHAWSAWSHDAGTAGAASRHKRVCGNDPAHTESEACAFSSTETPPTCTENGFTIFTCTECGYSYQGDTVAKTGHAWGAWSHDAGTAGAASRHKRVCGNDPAHTESEACTFSSAVTPPDCTEEGFTTFTCTVPTCAYRYTDAPVKALGHTEVIDPAVPATCTETGLTAGKHCSVCKEVLILQQVIPALGHLPGEWEVTVPPTNKKTGTQVKRCTRCGVILETMEIPILSMIWPDNTACSFGPRFRDELPELTDKWYMYTPLDLTKEGTLDVPLIASNRYRIGTAQVTVKDGQVYANYQVTADKVQVKQEFMTFLPGLDSLETIEPEALTSLNIPLDTPVDVASLGGSQALFFMRLVVTYDIYADGVQWWSAP